MSGRHSPEVAFSETDTRPQHGRALTDAIPGAHFIEFPNAAHGVTIERANEVNEALAQHIAAATAGHAAQQSGT
jgi:pimeloyl-ACP methyl ester carboxylesterase